MTSIFKLKRPCNIVEVLIYTESGCDVMEGEYDLVLSNFIGKLDINGRGDDISLIKECLENEFDFSVCPKEGLTSVILIESGEFDDLVWHKYYEVRQYNVLHSE